MRLTGKTWSLIFLSLTFHQNLWSQILTPNRSVDWTVAGLQRANTAYNKTVNITSFGGIGDGIQSNDGALQKAIGSLGVDSGVIYFPAGTYLFRSTVTLRSGVILRGDGAGNTTLRFNLSGVDDLLSIAGTATGTATNVTTTANKNDSFIVVNNTSLFAPNDWVKITQNDSALVLDAYKTVGQVLQIKSISNNRISFYHPLRRSYRLSDSANVQKLQMITGVGLECLTIKRLDKTSGQRSNVAYKYAANCWMRGVESDSCNFAHVAINNSTNLSITGSYFHGAFDYGPNGQGYGVAVQITSGECLVENNIFSHLRHAMLVQSGANGNVFSYNYSNQPTKTENQPFDLAGDIVLHGNYPYANLFEGNIVQNMVVDASHFKNGPYNTFLRNRAESYGFLVSDNSGDSMNIIGNEITNTSTNKGNYIVKGVGNFEYDNNVKGTVIPTSATTLSDSSYYYKSVPTFWNVTSPWPPIGLPNVINTYTIPAKTRVDSLQTLTICNNMLALASHSFFLTVQKQGEQNLLQWTLNNNEEVKTFEVERSLDGYHYNIVSPTINAVSNNTANYQFLDRTGLAPLVYYRIKQLQKSGSSIYSNVVTIGNHNGSSIKLFPNPAHNHLSFLLTNRFKNVNLTIKNVFGENMYSRSIINTGSPIQVDISTLAKGSYLFEIGDKVTGETIISRFVKH